MRRRTAADQDRKRRTNDPNARKNVVRAPLAVLIVRPALQAVPHRAPKAEFG